KIRPPPIPRDTSCSLSRLNRSNAASCACSAGAYTAGAARHAAATKTHAMLLRRTNGRPGKVGVKNGEKVLARARPADRAPLAHAHAVPVAVTAQNQLGERAGAIGACVDGEV